MTLPGIAEAGKINIVCRPGGDATGNSGRRKGMQKLVALFAERDQAGHAVEQLKNGGIAEERISLISRSEQKEWDYGEKVAEKIIGGRDGLYYIEGGYDTLAGAGIGGVAGALLGLSSLLVPGLGPLLVAGPAGLALIGAAAGSITGALADYGIPEEQSRHYEGMVKNGQTLVLVEIEDHRSSETISRLQQSGADDIEAHQQ